MAACWCGGVVTVDDVVGRKASRYCADEGGCDKKSKVEYESG